MNRRIRSMVVRFVGAAILALAFCFSAVTAHAQLGWDPPCTATKVVNLTACDITLNLQASPPVAPVTVLSGQSAPLITSAGTTIFGLLSQGGTFKPLVIPGPVMPPPAPAVPAAAWVSNVGLGRGCCVDVYFDQSSAPDCVIWLIPSGKVCLP